MVSCCKYCITHYKTYFKVCEKKRLAPCFSTHFSVLYYTLLINLVLMVLFTIDSGRVRHRRKSKMGAKIQMVTMVAGFVLYLVDIGSDAYVAFRHYENGDRGLFILTCTIMSLSVLLCNIYATTVLDAPWYLRILAFLSLFSMVYLFTVEIRRSKDEHFGSKARPCDRKRYFTKCDCGVCTWQMRKSAEASLKMSQVRSMETFVEAIPQLLLQVYAMVDRQSYPWYTIVAVVISFISLIFGIFSLEKNYWIRKILQENKYVKPVSFPTRAAFIFIFWQTLLLLARIGATVLIASVFHWLVLPITMICHWLIVITVLVVCETKINDCLQAFWKALGLFFLSFLFLYPLLFHVSHSSLAGLNRFIPRTDRMSKKFKTIATVLVPGLFFGMHCIVGIFRSLLETPRHQGKDDYMAYYGAILGMYIGSFIFGVFYHSEYFHPLKVTRRNWHKLQAQTTFVVNGRVNTAYTAYPY